MKKLLLVLCVLIFVLISLLTYSVLTGHGRGLWYPVYIKVFGGIRNEKILKEIIKRKPYLENANIINDLMILVYKSERKLYVYSNGKRITEMRVLAASGKIGPKLRNGDLQVPEGLYKIDGLNPNSSYYLSMKINYPNSDDIQRSNKMNIADYGNDIYIHEKTFQLDVLRLAMIK